MSWFTHGDGSGEVDPPPPELLPPVVNDCVDEGLSREGWTSAANVRETTFQKYVVPPFSAV